MLHALLSETLLLAAGTSLVWTVARRARGTVVGANVGGLLNSSLAYFENELVAFRFTRKHGSFD